MTSGQTKKRPVLEWTGRDLYKLICVLTGGFLLGAAVRVVEYYFKTQ